MNRQLSLLLAIIVIAVPITLSNLLLDRLEHYADKLQFTQIQKGLGTPPETAAPQITPLGTKKYTNLAFGYTFAYEADAALFTEETTVASRKLVQVPADAETVTPLTIRKPGSGGYDIQVMVNEYPKGLPLKAFIERGYNIQDNAIKATNEPYDIVDFDRPITRFEELTQYGVPAYVLETYTEENPHFDIKKVFILITPTQLLEITAASPIPSRYQHGFETIVSSFSLVNKVMTYRNDDWKLSFEYPGEATVRFVVAENQLRVEGPYPELSSNPERHYAVNIARLQKPSEQTFASFVQNKTSISKTSMETRIEPLQSLTVAGHAAVRFVAVVADPPSHYLNMAETDDVYIERSASEVIRVECGSLALHQRSKPVCDQVAKSLKFLD